MKTSTLHLPKLSLIEFILGIQDEKVFSKVESDIQKSIQSLESHDPSFSKNEVMERAITSNNQIKKNQVLSQNDLEKQIKNW